MVLELAVVGAVLLGLVAVLIWLELYERRRRREWHLNYFHRGGLIRDLMRRWRNTPKLTDQRDRRDRDEAE